MDKPDYTADLQQAVKTLREGGVILYPTDTVWGIGCDATNADAVRRVYELKQREESKSLIVLMDSVARVRAYVREFPDVAYDMMELADRPLTLILDGAKNLASNLVAADGSVGIRVSSERFSRELCLVFNRPIVSTSANISGDPTAAIYADIAPLIIDGVDYVVHYRRDDKTKSKPSSIVRLKADGQVTIIRQ